MNHSMINSMVSMNGLQQKLDILANNMANLNTVGYKSKEATFEDILTNMRQQPKGFEREGRLSPLGFNQGWGAKLSMVSTNFAQGTLQQTDQTTDLALEGDGLFKVMVPGSDPNQPGSALYTRDGAFSLSLVEGNNANVYLTTKEGNLVLGTNNQPIAIPKGQKMVVSEDGTVSSYSEALGERSAQVRGKLAVVRVLRPQFLQQIGDNLFTIPAGTAATQQDLNNIVQPLALGSNLDKPVSVRQGFLEQSNVNMADEMTELMTVQRAFQLSSRALTSSDTMAGLANTLRS